jgi:hypothetical protein
MPASPNKIDNDISGLSLADVLERLEAGRCGHTVVMEWLRIDSYHELVATMHFNGRTMPGHRKMIVTPETFELFSRLPKRNLEPQVPKSLSPRPASRPRDVA